VVSKICHDPRHVKVRLPLKFIFAYLSKYSLVLIEPQVEYGAYEISLSIPNLKKANFEHGKTM
jgi:hypothetical protein